MWDYKWNLISDLKEGEEIIEPIADRILGRTILTILLIEEKLLLKLVPLYQEAELIGDSGVESVHIRSVLTCDTKGVYVQMLWMGFILT